MSATISIDPNGMALAMQILPMTWWITSLLLKIYGTGSIIMTLCTIAVIVAKRFGSKRSKIKEMEVTDMTPPPQRIETPTSTATSAYDLLRDDEWDAMTIASEATIYQNGHVTDDNASDSDGTESDIYDDEWADIMAAENIQDIRDISHPPSATPQNGVIYPPSQDQLAAAESRLRACGVLLGNNDIGEFALEPVGLRQQREPTVYSNYYDSDISTTTSPFVLSAKEATESNNNNLGNEQPDPTSHPLDPQCNNDSGSETVSMLLKSGSDDSCMRDKNSIKQSESSPLAHNIGVTNCRIISERQLCQRSQVHQSMKNKNKLIISQYTKQCNIPPRFCSPPSRGKRAWNDDFWLGFYLPDVIKWQHGRYSKLRRPLAQLSLQ